MLQQEAYRDVRVIDVARQAGTSPATFYQYFPDIEAAVLELAAEAVRDSAELSQLVEGRSWTGKAGRQTAEELVDGVLAFWRRHDAILRVVDVSAAEGERRFVRIRAKVLGAVVKPLAEALEEIRRKSRSTAAEPPATAVAAALVTMVAGTAGQAKSLQTLGAKQADVRPALTVLVHLGMTGRKPAAG